ncbi:MAG: hypothetical protein JXR94_18955 [Candidatus Hydrogenedentes bacterium]|nr:hypothetical protein [Candidatus Hydrogenedentota bacterium]
MSAFAILLAGVSAFSLPGCAVFSYDVSGSKILWGEYERDAEYEVVMDVFLIRPNAECSINSCTGRKVLYHNQFLALVPERCTSHLGGQYSSPESVAGYLEDPIGAARKRFGTGFTDVENVVGVVKKGTRIRCTKLTRIVGGNLLTGYGVYDVPHAEILDGPFSGAQVDLSDLSERAKSNPEKPKAWVLKLNPRYLRRVEDS